MLIPASLHKFKEPYVGKTSAHPFESADLSPTSCSNQRRLQLSIPLLQARRGTAVFLKQEWGPEALWWMCSRRQTAEGRVSKLRKCNCRFLTFTSQLITNVLNMKSKRCLFLPLNFRVSQVNKPAFQGYNYIYYSLFVFILH